MNSDTQAHVRISGASADRPNKADSLAVLRAVDLQIQAGEFLSLVGPEGCGKSTLLRMVAGLFVPSAGEIVISGQSVLHPQSGLGMVFSEPALLEWRTALDNVLLEAEIRGGDRKRSLQKALELLSAMGLSGLERQPAGRLPPAVQYRISLARALVQDPPLLLLDEPSASIHALERENLAADIQRLWLASPRTVLLATRDVEMAVLLSDRIAVMSPRPGQILDLQAVELPRPRRLDRAMTPLIAERCNRVRMHFHAHGVLR